MTEQTPEQVPAEQTPEQSPAEQTPEVPAVDNPDAPDDAAPALDDTGNADQLVGDYVDDDDLDDDDDEATAPGDNAGAGA